MAHDRRSITLNGKCVNQAQSTERHVSLQVLHDACQRELNRCRSELQVVMLEKEKLDRQYAAAYSSFSTSRNKICLILCRSSKSGLSSAQAEFTRSARRMEKLGKRLRDNDQRLRELQEAARGTESKLTRLSEYTDQVRSQFSSSDWDALFAWDLVLEMNPACFRDLLGALQCLVQVAVQYPRCGNSKKRGLDESRTRADCKAGGCEASLAAARKKVIDAQISSLRDELRALPKIPPAAHEDWHNNVTPKRMRLLEQMEIARSMLDGVWPKDPEILSGYFFKRRGPTRAEVGERTTS